MIASEIDQLYDSFTRKVSGCDNFTRERLWITHIKPLCETTMSVRDVELVIDDIAIRAAVPGGESFSVIDVLEAMEARGELQVHRVDYKILELMEEVQELQKATSGFCSLADLKRQIKGLHALLKEGRQQWTALDQKRREMEHFMLKAQRVFTNVAGTHVVKAQGRLVGTVGGAKQVFEVDDKETVLHLNIL